MVQEAYQNVGLGALYIELTWQHRQRPEDELTMARGKPLFHCVHREYGTIPQHGGPRDILFWDLNDIEDFRRRVLGWETICGSKMFDRDLK